MTEVWERDGRRCVVESENGVVLVAVELLREMLSELGYRNVRADGGKPE